MLDILTARIERFQAEVVRLIGDYSRLCRRLASRLTLTTKPYEWQALPPAGKQLQTRLLSEHVRLSALIGVLIQTLPQDARQLCENANRTVRELIEQNQFTIHGTNEDAILEIQSELASLLKILIEYLGMSDGFAIVVPDTNALLFNPDIETWDFRSADQIELVLLPTVLAELDEQKVNHRNPDVRAKAETLISRIKEYRRRGPLTAGVPVVTDALSLRAIAVEPDLDQSLPWFDAANPDDHILASVLEVIRENLGRAVLLITRDINMQNKAELAGIPYAEPPTPGGAAPKKTRKARVK